MNFISTKMYSKILFLLFFSTISCFSRTINVNINSAQSNGSLFILNENVALGDVIRFTNNLGYSVTNVSGSQGMSTSISDNLAMNQNITIANNAFYEVVLNNILQTQFTFVHFNMRTGSAYNLRLNLTYPLNNSVFFSTNEYSFLNANPVKDNVVLQFKDLQDEVFSTIVNMDGKIIISNTSLNTKTLSTDVSNLSKGVYICSYRSANKLIVKKIIIN